MASYSSGSISSSLIILLGGSSAIGVNSSWIDLALFPIRLEVLTFSSSMGSFAFLSCLGALSWVWISRVVGSGVLLLSC